MCVWNDASNARPRRAMRSQRIARAGQKGARVAIWDRSFRGAPGDARSQLATEWRVRLCDRLCRYLRAWIALSSSHARGSRSHRALRTTHGESPGGAGRRHGRRGDEGGKRKTKRRQFARLRAPQPPPSLRCIERPGLIAARRPALGSPPARSAQEARTPDHALSVARSRCERVRRRLAKIVASGRKRERNAQRDRAQTEAPQGEERQGGRGKTRRSEKGAIEEGGGRRNATETGRRRHASPPRFLSPLLLPPDELRVYFIRREMRCKECEGGGREGSDRVRTDAAGESEREDRRRPGRTLAGREGPTPPHAAVYLEPAAWPRRRMAANPGAANARYAYLKVVVDGVGDAGLTSLREDEERWGRRHVTGQRGGEGFETRAASCRGEDVTAGPGAGRPIPGAHAGGLRGRPAAPPFATQKFRTRCANPRAMQRAGATAIARHRNDARRARARQASRKRARAVRRRTG